METGPKEGLQRSRQRGCRRLEGMGKSCSESLILDHLPKHLLPIFNAGCRFPLGAISVRSKMDVLFLEGPALPPPWR